MTHWTSQAVVLRSRQLLDSYAHWLGKELLQRSGDAVEDARRLFEAPFVVVSHGIEADPVLNYGNSVALNLWELDWEQFCSIPSRLTAEPMHRDERARMLAMTQQKGYFDKYAGIRISSTGQRFQIDEALIWNVLDESGNPAGQAATFANWRFI